MAPSDSEPAETTTGLADDRAYARTYPTEDQKATWKKEAEEQGLSLSKYIIAKVEESRARESITPPSTTPAGSGELDELESEIEKLRSELRRERQKNAGKRLVGDKEVVKRFITEQPQSLPGSSFILTQSLPVGLMGLEALCFGLSS